MTPEESARLNELCKQAAQELDSEKLYDLVTEINQILAAKEERLKRKHEQSPA